MLRLSAVDRSLRSIPLSSRLQVITGVASFVIYASAVVGLQQYRDNFFFCERVGLAAGVSHVVYGAPFGTVYPGIQARLLAAAGPVEPVLQETTRLGSPRADPVTAINDGNGLGFVVVATWALGLFGPNLFALPFFMLGLMGISAAVFLCRFGDDRSAVITVTFSCLTLMLCTPLVSDPDVAGQIPIGGIRFFSLLAVVPAFHLVFELADARGRELPSTARSRHTLLLAVQVVLLLLAVLVRGSTVFVAVPIFLVGLVSAWRNRANRYELGMLRYKATVIGVVGLVLMGSLLAVLPSRYVRDGRLTTIFWHRAIISLGVNPAWPFGNLREIYDCRNGGIPEGLVGDVADRNGHCIWWHYFLANDIPSDTAISDLYSSRYEAVMRAEFFNIIRRYPYETIATVFYYKPAWIMRAVKYLTLNPMLHSHLLVFILGASANFLGFLAIPASGSTYRMMIRLAGMGMLFGIASIPTYLVAWAAPHTTADLLFYSLFCTGLGISSAVKRIGAAVRCTSAMLMRA